MILDIIEVTFPTKQPPHAKLKQYEVVIWLTGKRMPVELGKVFLPETFDKNKILEVLNADL